MVASLPTSHARHHRGQLWLPLVNRNGELVGLVFDGNLEGLATGTSTTTRKRAIAVDGRAIIEALNNV